MVEVGKWAKVGIGGGCKNRWRVAS